jgi:hypothetical protein
LRETEKWFRGGENCFVRAGVKKQLGGAEQKGAESGGHLLDTVIWTG